MTMDQETEGRMIAFDMVTTWALRFALAFIPDDENGTKARMIRTGVTVLVADHCRECGASPEATEAALRNTDILLARVLVNADVPRPITH